MVVVSTEDGYITIFEENPKTKKFFINKRLEEPTYICVLSAVLSRDTNMIVAGAEEVGLTVWKRKDSQSEYEIFQPLRCHQKIVCSIDLTRDEKTLVSGSDDKTVIVWKKVGEKGFAIFQYLTGHSDEVWKVRVIEGGRKIFSGSKDKTVKIWIFNEFATIYECSQTLDSHTGGIRQIELSFDWKTLVTGSGDKTLKVWKCQKGGGKNQIESIKREDESLALGEYKLAETLTEHESGISALTVSRDAKLMVSADWNSKIIVWRANEGLGFSVNQKLESHRDSVKGLRLNSTGTLLASLGKDKRLKIWQIDSNDPNSSEFELIQSLDAHENPPSSLDMNEDGTIIATCAEDYRVVVWLKNHETGQFKNYQRLEGHTKPVQEVVLSKDDLTIFSCSSDLSIKVWKREPDIDSKLIYLNKWLKDGDFKVIGSNQTGKMLCTGGLK